MKILHSFTVVNRFQKGLWNVIIVLKNIFKIEMLLGDKLTMCLLWAAACRCLRDKSTHITNVLQLSSCHFKMLVFLCTKWSHYTSFCAFLLTWILQPIYLSLKQTTPLSMCLPEHCECVSFRFKMVIKLQKWVSQ